MSKQDLSLQNDWEEIQQAFQSHFHSQNLQIEDDKITYSKTGEHLEINRDASVSAGMPLHTNELQKAKRIQITDSEIKIYSENSEYIFRR